MVLPKKSSAKHVPFTALLLAILLVGMAGGYAISRIFFEVPGASLINSPLLLDLHGSVSGTIVEVDGHTIRIQKDEKFLTISVGDETSITHIGIAQDGSQQEDKNAALSDVKVGDQLFASFVRSENGTYEMQGISTISVPADPITIPEPVEDVPVAEEVQE